MRYFLAIALLVIMMLSGIWDVYAIAVNHPLDTVSRVLQDWSLKYPVLPMALGIILGHIFWPQNSVTIEHTQPNR